MSIWRMLSIVGGAVAGILIALSCSTREEAPPAPTELVPDSGGSLDHVCLHYCRSFHEQSFETLSDFIAAVAPDCRITVITRDMSEYRFLVQNIKKLRIPTEHLSPFPAEMPITPWAKDRFGTLRDKDGPLVAVPNTRYEDDTPRGNDERIPLKFARCTPGYRLKVLPFQFEGGDLLSDETHVFVAANFLARNQPFDTISREGLIETIERTFQRKAVVLGKDSTDVPDHHIGMYLTPLGKGRVAVADPDLGVRLCREQQIHTGVEVEKDDAAYQPFRRVIHELESKGFEILRIPMLLTTSPRVYVTYNNAILESSNGKQRIYMPVYEIPALDQAATDLFEKAGLQVKPIRVNNIYNYTGSLRCLVGILKRS